MVVFPDCVFDAPGPRMLMNLSDWSEFNDFWRVKLTVGEVNGRPRLELRRPRGDGDTVMVFPTAVEWRKEEIFAAY
jgi:hypothetical protein